MSREWSPLAEGSGELILSASTGSNDWAARARVGVLGGAFSDAGSGAAIASGQSAKTMPPSPMLLNPTLILSRDRPIGRAGLCIREDDV